MRYKKIKKRKIKTNNNRIKLMVVVSMLSIIFGLFIGGKLYFSYTYSNETKKMTSEELDVVNKVIDLAKEKESLEYVWGGKGEIMTEERLNELIGYYGTEYYPLDKSDYIGEQAFDCSGLVFWSYKEITGKFIGYSTTEQQEILKDYKVTNGQIQPGDLIYTPGHVVMYIGNGKIINSANKSPYPKGGVKIEGLLLYRFGDVYRPVQYIFD